MSRPPRSASSEVADVRRGRRAPRPRRAALGWAARGRRVLCRRVLGRGLPGRGLLCQRVPGRGLPRRGVLAAVAAAAALAAAGCSGGAIAQNTPVSNGSSFVSGSYSTTVYRAGSRVAAPDFSGRLLNGRALRLSAYRGHVVVLNFWGSWCSPCREEAPALAALARHFGSAGVRFLGVDIRDDPASAEAFMRDFRIPYPSLNDPGNEIALSFSGTVPPAGIPTTLVLDRGGRIAARIVGGVTYAGLKSLISQVYAGRS